MSELEILGELLKTVGLPGAIALGALYLNKTQRDQCRQDARDDRDVYIRERDKLYLQIETMNNKHIEIYDKVVTALEDFSRRHP